jgi:hypothetical protein
MVLASGCLDRLGIFFRKNDKIYLNSAITVRYISDNRSKPARSQPDCHYGQGFGIPQGIPFVING